MNFIKFLGTAGARFVVMKQFRASGGTWLKLGDQQLLIDPGPGALVACTRSRPKLDPNQLSGIILTHRHLDHSADVNIMIEAMTNGGFKKRGRLFAPRDALEEDPVVLQYLRGYLEQIIVLEEDGEYVLGDVVLETPVKHIHGVETYGLRFRHSSHFSISFITDTRYFKTLPNFYKADIIILNVIRYEPLKDKVIDHLSVSDAEKIIQAIKPQLCILTHFGITMLRKKPWKVVEAMEQRLNVPVIAARDGMLFDLDPYVTEPH